MLKNLTIKIVILVIILFLTGLVFYNNYNLRKQVVYYDNNIKALSLERDSLNSNLIAYKLDIEELEMLNDSIIENLNTLRKELKIKDNQLLQMQSVKVESHTKDSIFIKDTIFRDNFIGLDTNITNPWYNIKIKLEYPSTLKLETNYKSDLSVFAYSKKEILGIPKKCFLGRIFQKRYKVIRVEVHDRNPHSIIKESKFVIIE